MKQPSTYIVSIILTLLLIFLMIGAAGAGTVQFCALNTGKIASLTATAGLPEKVQEALVEQFHTEENTTGNPPKVVLEFIEAEKLKPIIEETVTNGFAYICGNTATLGVTPDFTELDQALHTFFVQYAEEHNIAQDAAFEEAFRQSADATEEKILNACDVFRFGQLNDAGVLKQAKRFAPWAGFLAAGMFAACALVILVLLLVHHQEREHFFYWTATAAAIASVVLLIPAAWLQHERWFDRFAIKTDQTFAAVTGYLYMLTHAVIVTAIGGLIAAAVIYLLFLVLHLRRRNHESVKHARH